MLLKQELKGCDVPEADDSSKKGDKYLNEDEYVRAYNSNRATDCYSRCE